VGIIIYRDDNKSDKIFRRKSMAEDLNVTEGDRIKYEKIQKAKAFEEKVNKAVESIPTIQESVTELKEKLCEGPDCLEKRVERQFSEIDDKVDAMARHLKEKVPGFICEECGYDNVPALASYCPQCGSPINIWEDEDGKPIKGWRHWSERNK
jgi:FtsZ-binding cell division protein ZapB